MSETPQEQRNDTEADRGRDEQEGLEAEQESAAAMDADVPQPPDDDETTPGHPS